MKMIDVLNLVAQDKLKLGTMLKVGSEIYTYIGEGTESDYAFITEKDGVTVFLEDEGYFSGKFLNSEARLIPEEKMRYRIKIPHSSFYLGFERKENGEKDFMPYIKDLLELERSAEMIDKGVTEKDLKFRTQFTKQEFEEIGELYPYKSFKELVKDDDYE